MNGEVLYTEVCGLDVIERSLREATDEMVTVCYMHGDPKETERNHFRKQISVCGELEKSFTHPARTAGYRVVVDDGTGGTFVYFSPEDVVTMTVLDGVTLKNGSTAIVYLK